MKYERTFWFWLSNLIPLGIALCFAGVVIVSPFISEKTAGNFWAMVLIPILGILIGAMGLHGVLRKKISVDILPDRVVVKNLYGKETELRNITAMKIGIGQRFHNLLSLFNLIITTNECIFAIEQIKNFNNSEQLLADLEKQTGLKVQGLF